MNEAPASTTGVPRATLAAVVNLGLCTFICLYATQPVLPLFERLFDADKAAVGLTISASTAAVAVTAPWVGWLGGRLSRKGVIVAASFALALATFLAGTAHNLQTLLGWRVAQGACVATVYVTAVTYITEEVPPWLLGRAFSAFVSGNVLGGFTGRMVAAWVAEAWGWRAIFITLGGVTLLGACVTARALPRSQRAAATVWPQALGHDVAPRSSLRAVLRRPLLATLFIGSNVLFCQVAIFTYAVFYLSGPPFHLGAASLSGIFVSYLAGAAITPIAGRAIDRVGPRRVLTWSLLAGACGALITCIPLWAAVTLGLGICCTSTFVCQAAGTSFLRQAAAPEVRPLASGLYTTAYYTGGSLGGFAPGLAWDAFGWVGCVGLVVTMQAAALVVARVFWPDSPSR